MTALGVYQRSGAPPPPVVQRSLLFEDRRLSTAASPQLAVDAASETRALTGFVYIIEAQNGLVKIGYGHEPEARLKLVNLHSPIPARLIAMWPGSGKDERALHRDCNAQRSHNEWFVAEGRVATLVAERRGVGVAAIPSWDDAGWAGQQRKLADLKERMSAAGKARWADPSYRALHERNRAARKASRAKSREA